VVVGTADELLGTRVTLEDVNWLAPALAPGDRCLVQVRYRSRAVPARVTAAPAGSLALALDEPARAITPGQSGALYDRQGRLLGGGVIAG
jgi:tRNA-uridine 2-sulfurtransferase